MKLLKFLFLFISLQVCRAQITSKAYVDHVNPNGTDSTGSIYLDVSGGTPPYTYSWTPGSDLTRDITSHVKQQYRARIKDSGGDSASYAYNIGYKVKWTDFFGTLAVGDTLASTGTHAWSTALSKNTLRANTDGWFEEVLQGSGNYEFIGFSDSASTLNDYAYNDIDYGVYKNGTYLYFFSNGYFSGLGYISEGAVLRIERVGDTVRYKLNETEIWSGIDPAGAHRSWKLKAAVNQVGSPIANIGCSFSDLDSMVFPNYVKVIPRITHCSAPGATDGAIIASPMDGNAQTYTWSPGSIASSSITARGIGTYTVLVKDSLQNRNDYTYHIGYKAKWTNLYGTAAGHDTLASTGIHAWSSALSENTLRPHTDGWFEQVLQGSDNYEYIGFLDSASTLNAYGFNDIDYGVYKYQDLLYLFSNGAYTALAFVAPGDVLRIERRSDTVLYLVNGLEVWSGVDPACVSQTWKVKAAVNQVGSPVVGIGCSFYHTDSAVFANYVKVFPRIIHSSGPGISDGSIAMVAADSAAVQSYTWSPGNTASASIGSLPAGSYTVVAADSLHNESSYPYQIGYKTRWTSLSGCTLSNDTLLPDGTLTWGTALSRNVLPASTDGWLEYVVQNVTEDKPIGFLDSVSAVPQDYNDITYGFYQSQSILYLFSKGYFYNLGQVQKGDVARIERSNYIVNYKINGITVYTGTDSAAYGVSWRIKAALYPNTSEVNIGCSFSTPLSLFVTKQSATGEDLRGGMIAAIPYNGTPPYRVTLNGDSAGLVMPGLAAGDYTVAVTDSTGDQRASVVSIGYEHNWRVIQDVSVPGDTFNISTGDTIGRLVSYNSVFQREDGWTEITVGKKNQDFSFGFIGADSTEADSAYTVPYTGDVKLGQKLAFVDSLVYNEFTAMSYTANAQFAKAHVVAFHNGTATALFKGSARAAIPYDIDDVFKLRRTAGIIYLEKNGQVVAQESAPSNSQYLVSLITVNSAQAIIRSPSFYTVKHDQAHLGQPLKQCAGDNTYNWTYSRTFDETGTVKDEAKQYMDGLGRTIQSQSRLFSKNNTLVSQPVYDAFGRAVGQTLPAPSYNTTLCYAEGFMTNSSAAAYSYTDHDLPLNNNSAGELYNPKAVGNSTQGTLGWYYSNNNSSESLVAASEFPYSRVEFYDDPLGRPKKAGGVGSDHKLGSRHETTYIYTSTPNTFTGYDKNELAYVFPYATYELAPDFTTPVYGFAGQTSTVKNQNLSLFKTIMLNADGKDQVSYTNSAGQVIATCVTGDAGGCGQDVPATQDLGTISSGFGKQVYIPIKKTNTLKIHDDATVSTQTLTPVIKDLLAGHTLVSGTDYTYNSSTGAVTFAGTYSDGAGKASRSLYLDVSYSSTAPTGGHRFVAECAVNYTQWSLYFYDRKGRLLANVAPNDITCQTPPTPVHKDQAQGPVAVTCDAGSPNLLALTFRGTGSPLKEGVVLIRPTASAIDTFALVSQPYDPVYKADSLIAYDDSVFIAGLDSILPDSSVAVIDTAFTNHIYVPSDSVYALLVAMRYRLPSVLAGKGLTYTGNYRIYIDSSATPLPQAIPFDFSVVYDGQGNPTLTNHRQPATARLDSAAVAGASKLYIRSEHVKVGLIGFGTDSLASLCNGTLALAPAERPVFTGIFQHVGIAAGVTVLAYDTAAGYGTANYLDLFATYTYDEYDRLIASHTQDEGRVDYLYDQAEDKLFFTQNDKQRANGGKFSALIYDKLGRVVETGEYSPPATAPGGGIVALQFQTYDDYFKNSVAPASGYTSVGAYASANTAAPLYSYLQEANHIVYDTLDRALPAQASGYSQAYTAAKVSKTYNAHDTTWYSYDDLGRQAWSVQYLDGLNAFKTMDYTYDFRGKLLKTQYQKGSTADKLTHLYSYDGDERLSAAFLMHGSSATQVPVAAYEYYLHSPLKRTVLGNSLQGLDYVYTIGGQLKSLNNPMATSASQDPGQDSYSTGLHASVKADVFGYTLDYYNDDYVRSGSPIKAYNSSSYTGQNVSYAGLVKAMRWKTMLPSGVTDDYSGAARMYEYNYNDLYQFTGATFGTTAISGGNVAFTPNSDYGLSGLTYDDNGNMKALQRYKKAVSGTASLLDNLTYNYHSTKTNRLLQVQDAATTSGIAADMDLPNQSSGTNYTYNAIGELTANAQEDQGFEYNASGLCTRAYQISTGYNLATFEYNDKGMRHSKTSYDNTGTAVKTTWYVYDAGGAQVATYEKDLTVSGSPVVKDFMVYAAGRMGIYDAAGAKIYFELSDHLGNTRAIVTETSGNAEVVSFTDYYPHGGVMPGQNYTSSLAYRYGYQGQEKDPETGLVNFELRQYDPRLGRWYNPDPMEQHHSPYLAMGNNPVSMGDPNGGWDGGDLGAMPGINAWAMMLTMMENRLSNGVTTNSYQERGMNSFSTQSSGDWNFGKDSKGMSPLDRVINQEASGTSYSSQNFTRLLSQIDMGLYGNLEHTDFKYGGSSGIWESESDFEKWHGSNGNILFEGKGGALTYHMVITDEDMNRYRWKAEGAFSYAVGGFVTGFVNGGKNAFNFVRSGAWKSETWKNLIKNNTFTLGLNSNDTQSSSENADLYDYSKAAGDFAFNSLAANGIPIAGKAGLNGIKNAVGYQKIKNGFLLKRFDLRIQSHSHPIAPVKGYGFRNTGVKIPHFNINELHVLYNPRDWVEIGQSGPFRIIKR